MNGSLELLCYIRYHNCRNAKNKELTFLYTIKELWQQNGQKDEKLAQEFLE